MSDRDSSKPLDALTVKRHKEGVLADTAPHRGLRLKANKNGTKTWVYRYKVAGDKLRQIKLGSYPSMTLSEARAAYIKQKSIRETHGDPREFRDLEMTKQKEALLKESMTGYLTAQMIDHYLIEHVERHRC
ncbi:MAG TPA: Arm DNA-binding domain-containing protein [Cellvibrio sp.]|nr:Arm DNA-binding domain-containing protein [Cellvibrio sp.]